MITALVGVGWLLVAFGLSRLVCAAIRLADRRERDRAARWRMDSADAS